MGRTISACPSPPSRRSSKMSFEIAIVTPLFGGGTKPGVNDPVTLIRGTTIRGQLRFWWRATRGARFATRSDLKKEEDRIWGSTEVPSPVSLIVEVLNKGKSKPCAVIPPGKSFPKFEPQPLGYVLFPFAGMGTPPQSGTYDAVFQLALQCGDPFLEKDISAALWAWINFGGLGARTRRGCGALYCKEFSPSSTDDVKQWYSKKLKEFEILTGSIRPWPTIPGIDGLLINKQPELPMKSWEDGAALLRKFRQDVGVGRNQGTPPTPGRSRWPEPDSIRSKTGHFCPKHKTPGTPVEFFPRAEFGLPIIFKFKDDKAGDPEQSELVPGKGFSRMASPIITKPLAIEKGKACSMILRLVTEQLNGAVLKIGTAQHLINASQIRNQKLTSDAKSPLNGTPPPYSALDAFILFAKKGGYK